MYLLAEFTLVLPAAFALARRIFFIETLDGEPRSLAGLLLPSLSLLSTRRRFSRAGEAGDRTERRVRVLEGREGRGD